MLPPPPPRILNILAWLTILALLTVAPVVQAADITVSDTCSLANAITSANADTATGGCAAGSGADTITLPSGDIILSADLPDITTDMTITTSAEVNISGNSERRIFKITGGTVTISEINLTSGNSTDHGGAVLIEGGTVTLSNLWILDTTSTNGGAVTVTGGSVTINSSSITGNDMSGDEQWGAGIRVTGSGTLSITGSSIQSNTKTGTNASGGALFAESSGTLTISNSDFRNNEGSAGAAIFVSTGQHGNVTVTNTTFFNNRAVGGGNIGIRAGIYIDGGGEQAATYTFQHITMSNNTGPVAGAGVQFYRHLNSAKSIVLANSIIDSPNDSDDCALEGSGGTGTAVFTNNLIEDGSCSATVTGDPLLLDQQTSGDVAYYPLNDISPAIGAGDDTTCAAVTTDVTGANRPATGCDLGAKENPLTGQQSQGTATAYGNQTATSVQATANFVGTGTMMAKDTATQAQQYVNETATMEANILGTARALRKKKERKEEAEATLTALASDPTATPTQAATCENMGNGVTVTGLAGGNAPQCNIMPASVRGDVVANDEIHAAGGYIDAVDIWGWIGAGVEVCFDKPGGLVFLDASTAPRTLYRITSYVGINGITCAFIDREGTVVLMHENLISPGWLLAPWEAPEVLAAAPVAAPAEGAAASSSASSPYQALVGCMVRTEYGLYFRVSPDGPLTVPQTVPYDVTLTALERTADWFHVDYYGARGWISAAHVTPIGSCG